MYHMGQAGWLLQASANQACAWQLCNVHVMLASTLCSREHSWRGTLLSDMTTLLGLGTANNAQDLQHTTVPACDIESGLQLCSLGWPVQHSAEEKSQMSLIRNKLPGSPATLDRLMACSGKRHLGQCLDTSGAPQCSAQAEKESRADIPHLS